MPETSHPTRSQIEARQLILLRQLMTVTLNSNAFYQRKYSTIALDPNFDSLDQFRRLVPFTTKTELVEDQAATPPYGTNRPEPLDHYTRFHQTSGTTGTPLRWLDTPQSWNAMLGHWGEVFVAAGLQPSDRVLFTFSFGPFIGFWLAFESAQQLGALCIPGGGLSSSARLRLLVDNDVDMLCCTPTYALRLGEVAAAEGIDLTHTRLRRIIAAGEPGASIPAVRERIAALFPGASVFDHHGMTEVGPVTFECPAQPGLLTVIEPGFLAEVIDPDTTEPVPDGEPGELVLTTLERVAAPLIRYRTGDLVRMTPAGQRLPCGRANRALTGGILGRIDDMVTIRGVNIYPSAVDAVLRQLPGMAEYQVEIDLREAMPELRVRIEPAADHPDPNSLAREAAAALNLAFSMRIPVQLVTPGFLPRFEMKANRWKRLTETSHA